MNVVTEFSSSEEERGVELPRNRLSSNISRHTHNISMLAEIFFPYHTADSVQFVLKWKSRVFSCDLLELSVVLTKHLIISPYLFLQL